MFVKIENYYHDVLPLIINIDCISTICPILEVSNNQTVCNSYQLTLDNNRIFNLNDKQYRELCKILTTRL